MSTKKIVVQWRETPHDKLYQQTMYVVRSDHPRFVDGSRFDYGFMSTATREGYTIEVWPIGGQALEAQEAGMTDEDLKRMAEEVATTIDSAGMRQLRIGWNWAKYEALKETLSQLRDHGYIASLPKGRASEGEGAQTQQVVAPQENLSHTS